MEFIHCPSLLLTLFLKLLCDLSCQRVFFGPVAYIVLPGRLDLFPLSLSQPAISLKPFCVLHSELSLLSCATPLRKITTICPFSVFHLLHLPSCSLFCPSVSLFYTQRPKSNDSEVSEGWISRSTFYLFSLVLRHHLRTGMDSQTHSLSYPPFSLYPFFPTKHIYCPCHIPTLPSHCTPAPRSYTHMHTHCSLMLFGFVILEKNTPS